MSVHQISVLPPVSMVSRDPEPAGAHRHAGDLTLEEQLTLIRLAIRACDDLVDGTNCTTSENVRHRRVLVERARMFLELAVIDACDEMGERK